MKRYFILLLILGAFVGCGKKHPVKVYVDPAMKEGSFSKIAVLHFTSTVHHSDDPDEEAPRLMDQLFLPELDTRQDYQFIAPKSVAYALEREGLSSDLDAFIETWKTEQHADTEFLVGLSRVLQVDAILIGVVDLWQKDEVDYRENASPATYVGATISVVGVEDGKVLFQASDEDFLETARSEERTVMTSGLGSVQNDPGARVYRAPEFEEVAVKVCRALVSSIPSR